MRLGSRWPAGEPPHPSVPAALHPEIADQEAAHPGARSWTLTWLEGRPHCALDDRVEVSLAADGRILRHRSDAGHAGGDRTVAESDDDDGWLS